VENPTQQNDARGICQQPRGGKLLHGDVSLTMGPLVRRRRSALVAFAEDRLYGVTVPWVRIPPSPPCLIDLQGFSCLFEFPVYNGVYNADASPLAWG
jgi:hypothetical protein